MSIKYYYTTITSDTHSEFEHFRLFAVIEESWYWAIEWKSANKEAPSYLTDFNTGAMSDTVRKSLTALTEISPAGLRDRFGRFADYIERAASGFRSYITWICPDSEMQSVIWKISG